MPPPGPTERTTTETWVAAHPWLAGVASFHAGVESAASTIESPGAPVPDWTGYAADYLDGVPLLHSKEVGIDLGPVAPMVRSLVGLLSTQPLPEPLGQAVRSLGSEIGKGDDARQAADFLFGEGSPATSSPGLLRCLAWILAARHLRPVVAAFSRWRDDDRWLRNYCPTCGSPPAMAQLVGVDPERTRLLACGRCRTRWRYRRTSCPFCDDPAERLAVLTIGGEPRLRIDYCERCRGYLKAYLGEGDESVFLADWTSMHLDVAAVDRGLQRLAGSLYELPALDG